MGFQDRQWYKSDSSSFGSGPSGGGSGSPFGRISGWSVWMWIIAINIVVYVVDALLGRITQTYWLSAIGHFSAETAIQHLQIWRFITFQFLHSHNGISHILFNMLFIFFFGRLIETYLGSRRFLAFYLLCGVAGPIAYLICWQTGFLVTAAGVPMVGASAGVFGILVAAALIAPKAKVLLFFVFPVELRTMAWFAVLFAAFTVLTRGDQPMANAGGEAAHLGGAALGYLLIRKPHLLNWASGKSASNHPGSGGGGFVGKIQQAHQQRKTEQQRKDAEQIDRILDKVHREGLGSLTENEKRLLQRATNKQRDE